MSEQSTAIKVVNFRREFVIDTRSLENITQKPTKKCRCGIRRRHHENKAFCLHFLDGDRGAICIFRVKNIVEKVTSLGRFRVV